ncbi:MAG: MBL fold metallo-hydrolase [Rhodoferax sp.]|nr:MBL fold metallo-hydrolase [Rhodoferax sp.]
MKPLRYILLGLLVFAAGSLGAAGLDDYKSLRLPEATRAAAGTNRVTVMFLGVATLLFDDGETAIMIDGYLTRVPFAKFKVMAPDDAVLKKHLARAGVGKLAAVAAVHSHFDHALDSPRVAQFTGAMLLGSESTANIGRGQGLAESQIKVVKNGDSLLYGKFKITFLTSAHLPSKFGLGQITEPLQFPVHGEAMKLGEAFSILVENEGRSYLIQGSAGFSGSELTGRKADVVFLGTGGLGATAASYQSRYWDAIVKTVSAKRVVPIHWDNFYLPLDVDLVPAPGFDKSMDALIAFGKKDEVEIRLPVEWQWTEPTLGLK